MDKKGCKEWVVLSSAMLAMSGISLEEFIEECLDNIDESNEGFNQRLIIRMEKYRRNRMEKNKRENKWRQRF